MGWKRFEIKTLEIVPDQSLHAGILRNLARARFFRALRADGMSRSEAIGKCRQARSTAPESIPFGAYVAVLLAIVLPGGLKLARSPSFRSLRRLVASILRYIICHQPRSRTNDRHGSGSILDHHFAVGAIATTAIVVATTGDEASPSQ